MKIRPGVELANLTDVGLVRENNEDYYGYWEPEDDEEFRRKGRLAIVADGMGGYEGGEHASRLAVETMCQVYRDSPEDPQTALLVGIQTAHQLIQKQAREHAELSRMGTTCTAISLTGDKLYFAHVGDSRLYLVRNQQLTRLTNDHSRVHEMVQAGILKPQDAENHPERNVLSRALGAGGESMRADIPDEPVALKPGDTLLLCSDGLWGVVGDEGLLEALKQLSPRDACKELVRRARECGAPDNITLQVLRIE
jgi:PPM family protein phosphatase